MKQLQALFAVQAVHLPWTQSPLAQSAPNTHAAPFAQSWHAWQVAADFEGHRPGDVGAAQEPETQSSVAQSAARTHGSIGHPAQEPPQSTFISSASCT
jgi:hypothetical protein